MTNEPDDAFWARAARDLDEIFTRSGEPGILSWAAFEEIEDRVGAAIRSSRVAGGMSQAELATRLRDVGFAVQQSTIAKIEAGTRPIRVAELRAIAVGLRVPWITLMLQGDDLNEDDASDSEVQRLFEFVEAAKEEAEKALIEQVKVAARIYAEADARSVRYARRLAAGVSQPLPSDADWARWKAWDDAGRPSPEEWNG